MTVSKELQRAIDATAARVHQAANKRARLLKVLDTLNSATKHQDQVKTNLAALDETERKAMAAWAAAGATGKAPTFDHAARTLLNQELSEASAKAAASSAAAESLQTELHSANRDMVEVASDLNVHALAAVAEHAEELAEEYRHALTTAAQAKMAIIAMERFFGARQNLDERRTTAFVPIAQKAMRHDLNIEQLEQRAFIEASARWETVFVNAQRIENIAAADGSKVPA